LIDVCSQLHVPADLPRELETSDIYSTRGSVGPRYRPD